MGRRHVTGMFAGLIHFPFLVFIKSPDVYVMAGALSLLAGLMGAVRALHDVVALPPAVAMQPPAPARFHRVLPERLAAIRLVSQPTVIAPRNVSHHPLRAAFTLAGMALAPAIIIVSLYLIDTTEDLIDVTFFLLLVGPAARLREIHRAAAANRRGRGGPASGGSGG
jgi:putative ABC transport system permease protein